MNSLKECVRDYRKIEKDVSVEDINNLVSSIDIEDNSISRRFEPPVFSVVLETLLQADASREAERGFYILTVRSGNLRHWLSN